MRLIQGEGGRCFSRAEPRHKQAIVRLLKEMGEVTAMTGAPQPLSVCRLQGSSILVLYTAERQALV